jgi:hypothetical protein
MIKVDEKLNLIIEDNPSRKVRATLVHKDIWVYEHKPPSQEKGVFLFDMPIEWCTKIHEKWRKQ